MVGALIVPDFKIDQLFSKYARIRHNLPKERDEVKGRLLSEAQIAKVVEILRRNSCIFEAHVIEMSFETAPGIEEHRKAAANGLTSNLTDQHQPELVEQVWRLRGELEAMAAPLYVQYAIMSELLADLISEIPVYWAQRRMRELINFHWVVDGKGRDGLTKSEKWWSTVKSGLVQSKLARKPMIALKELDYSLFNKKFKVPMPEYLKETILPHEESLSLNLLLDESFRFSSGNDFGLELVDILTNATRRALKGNLGKAGWGDIPKVMINRPKQYLQLRALSKSATPDKVTYGALITGGFAVGGRPMLTK